MRWRSIVAAMGAAAAFLSWPAESQEPLSLAELDEVRAGFDVGGFQFASIGAELRAVIDGVPVATSTVTWNDGGVSMTQDLHDLTDVVGIDQAAAHGLNVSNLEGTGVVVPGVGGATAVIQSVEAGRILNIAVNNANSRHIELNSEFTFVVPNLPELQESIQFDQLRAGLDAALNASLIDALR